MTYLLSKNSFLARLELKLAEDFGAFIVLSTTNAINSLEFSFIVIFCSKKKLFIFWMDGCLFKNIALLILSHDVM